MVAYANYFVDRAVPVRQGCSSRIFPARLDVHSHRARLHEHGIDRRPHRQRIVNRAAGKSRPLVQTDLESRDHCRKFTLRAALGFQTLRVRFVQERHLRHVEADHRYRPAGVEYRTRRLRVAINIEFRRCVHVPAGDGSSHQNHSFG